MTNDSPQYNRSGYLAHITGLLVLGLLFAVVIFQILINKIIDEPQFSIRKENQSLNVTKYAGLLEDRSKVLSIKEIIAID